MRINLLVRAHRRAPLAAFALVGHQLAVDLPATPQPADSSFELRTLPHFTLGQHCPSLNPAPLGLPPNHPSIATFCRKSVPAGMATPLSPLSNWGMPPLAPPQPFPTSHPAQPPTHGWRHPRPRLPSLIALIVWTGLLSLPASPQTPPSPPPGKAAYDEFTAWRRTTSFAHDWGKATTAYRAKLKADGHDDARAARWMEAIETYGEAELYDGVYTSPPSFNTQPNRLLVEAVKGRPPGKALDAAMGQGRNSVFLASQGWDVTGFDVSQAGLDVALRLAKSRAVTVNAVLSSDLDFEFGENRWDLIALIYLIESRSVHRVRKALRPGGIVVVEAGHRSVSNAPFEYASNELLQLFAGFRILRYEETLDKPDWGDQPIRLVRLVAEKVAP
jgi:hypothetical protein